MPEPLDDVELERLIHDTRTAIDSLRTGRSRPDESAAEGEGTASEERVRATVRAGRVESITFDPRLLRLPSEELGTLLRDAVNAALDDLREKTAQAGPVPDLAAFAETLRMVQNEGLRQMKVITEGIADAMARIRERTRVSGDPSPQGLEHLLSLTRRNLDDAIATAGAAENLRGEGETARGRIRVVATVGRVESVAVDRQATRMASHELAEQVRAAVNAALDDLRSAVRQETGADRPSAEELTERVREVQDMSLAQMRAYTRALRDIMTSIEGPE